MQKWEYLFVTAYVADGNWHPRYLNAIEVQDWDKGQTLQEYINDVGNEGWELVSEYLDPNVSNTKWVYSWVWADGEWKELKTSDDQKYRGMEGYVEFMNKMGQNGWELATTTVETILGGYRGNWLLLFKHPIENAVMRLSFKRPKT